MALVVGLDIGTKTLTGAVFSGNVKKFRLVDYFTEEIEELRSGDYSEDGEYVAPLSREELLAKVLPGPGPCVCTGIWMHLPISNSQQKQQILMC